MNVRTVAAAIAALSLSATPVMAQAATKAPASTSVERTSAKSKKTNEAAGGTGIIIDVLAAYAVIGGIVLAADSHSNTPVSP